MWMMPLHLHVNQKSDYDDDGSGVFYSFSFKVSTFWQQTVKTDQSDLGLYSLAMSHKKGNWLI